MDADLNLEYNPQFAIEGVKFRFYSADEIRALSVKKITNVETFDNLGHANVGGLYDPALGTSEHRDLCYTCGLSCQNCPGHMGHIELALPLFNTVVCQTLYQLLKATCFKCHRVNVEESAVELLLAQCRLLNQGLAAEANELQGIFAEIDKSSDKQDKINEIQELAEKASHDHEQNLSHSRPTAVKNVEAVKLEILKFFTRTYLKRLSRCIHCLTPIQKLSMEQNAKLFVVGGRGRASAKSNTSTTVQSDDDSDENDDDDDDGQPKKKKQKTQARPGNKGGDVTLITPLKVREHLREVWKLESELLKQIYPLLGTSNLEHPTDIFFKDVVPVPPTKFRPISIMNGRKFENPQTSNLLRVLKCNQLVRDILWEMEKAAANTQVEKTAKYSRDIMQTPGKSLIDKLGNALTRLQSSANAVIDSDLDRLSDDVNPGIKQIIEKKEGLFRKNMMGKRVNFAARSVISPDPNINTCEIGIPEVFAKVLSYPQPVTPWNVQELRQAVINGPDIYPGATHVIEENGYITRLDSRFPVRRQALAKQLLTPTTAKEKNLTGVKKVLRHLKNGDVLLINRQPTLHRPSIQAHKARVLKGEKTLRLHYANCKAYNADFDGDEMNAHFPQNEIARSEAYNLACTDFQYLVPKDGTPLAGLIQDHMVSGVSLTVRGRFFIKDDYCRLVYGALVDKSGPVKLLPPSIIKPVKLWSGKQVLSTVVLNVIPDGQPALSLKGSAKVPEKSWIKEQKTDRWSDPLFYMLESQDVIFRQGELLCGVLDKGHYGPSNYGLIHCCYELYGGAIAGKMLTCFGRLFMNFLQWRGFTLGVEDILVTKQGDKKRRRIIKKSPGCGEMTVKKALDLELGCSKDELESALKNAHFCKDERQMRELDMNMRNETNTIQNDIVSACMPNNLEKLFPDNNLQLMVQSGAKGSMVNCMQISCLLGQIELEGKRPPLMLSGKTLPSFLSYDVTPRAGGFVTGRFLTGIRQQEYFFHCMAGREGLVDTAVKTSRSGYLQRCLIKHLEGIKVNYDLTVRDSDSSIIQFMYGEDSLDISKTGFLTPKQFPFLIANKHILGNKQHKACDKTEGKQISKLEKKIRKWQKNNKHDTSGKVRRSGFLKFCQDVGGDLDIADLCESAPGRSEKDWKLYQLWKNLGEKEKKKFEKKAVRCPDPVSSKFSPYHLNVLPEKLADTIKDYAKKKGDEEHFSKLMNVKLQQSVIEPGEAVGLLCAQSIGEPSTQMTLNTFHFAGRGEMNVTLGIPRLREILMVGSKKIKTPALDIPVLPGEEARKKVQKVQRNLTKVKLDEVVQNIQVCEWLAIKGKIKVQRRRVFRILLNFLPRECYKERFSVGPNKILKFVEKSYIRKLVQLIRAKINAQHKLLSSGTQKRLRQPRETEENEPVKDRDNDKDDDDDDDDDEEMDADDGDDTAIIQKRKKMEEHEYDEEEENSRDSFDKEIQDEDVDMEGDLPETDDIEEQLIEEYEEKDQEKENPEARTNTVLQLAPEIEHYRYDLKKKLWCEVTVSFPLQASKIDLLALIESDIKKHVVHEVPGITRCILGEQDGPQGKELHLKTEGINMHELYKNADILDINRLYCNSIYDMSATYGIEAASRVVIKEIQAVFAAYGINVDYRHLSLLADYMTFEGSYKSFNRIAIESNPSPLQQMSFEQTMKFLVQSSVKSRTDSLQSPSAQIVLGKTVSCGTGCMDLFTPLTAF